MQRILLDIFAIEKKAQKKVKIINNEKNTTLNYETAYPTTMMSIINKTEISADKNMKNLEL